MAAKTLEAKLANEIEAVYIDALLLHRGRPLGSVSDRLDYMRRRVEEAQAIQARIEKRDARKAAKS